MDANMSQITKKEVLAKLRRRYEVAGKPHRIKLITEVKNCWDIAIANQPFAR